MEMSDRARPRGLADLGTKSLLYMDDGRYKGSTQVLPPVLPTAIPEKTQDTCPPSVKTLPSTLRDEASLVVCSPSVKTLPSTLQEDAPIRPGHPHLLQTLSTAGLLSTNCDGSHFADSGQEPHVDTDAYVAPDGSEYINIPRMFDGRSILDEQIPLNVRMMYIAHNVREGKAVQTQLSTREINIRDRDKNQAAFESATQVHGGTLPYERPRLFARGAKRGR